MKVVEWEQVGAGIREALPKPTREAALERQECLGTGPLSFWFLNHELEDETLRAQMEELKAKGFSGFFLHPRGGLRIPYGPSDSRRWRETILFCVREARKLGLEAWLYDEDPYPSGAVGGRILLERPELRATHLVPTVQPITGPGPITVDLPEGALAGVYLIDDCGGITRRDEAAGLVRSEWRQSYSHSSYYPPYSHEGGPHWRAETRAPHYQVRIDHPPAGGTLVAFVRQPSLQNPWGEYPDLLNAEAVRLFIRYTHDAYAALLGAECGTTVPGIFTDEAKLKGGLPWSASVPDWFAEIAGTPLADILPHLAVEIDGRTAFYRWAYRKALARGLRLTLLEPVRAACHRHRLLLTGHVSPEEDPIGQVIFAPGLMGLIGRMDLPGTDLIGSLTGSAEYPLLHLSPKLASSAAHGHGKRWITCEAFAVYDWSQDLATLTRSVHWLYALGVNRLITHGQFYSIDGLRKREAPPSQFIQAASWEHFGAFSGMVGLLSRELGRGRHVAPLLVCYPEDSFMALLSGELAHPAAERLRERLGQQVHELLTHGYDFDFVDEELLLQVEGGPGEAALGEERFAAILIPGTHLSLAAWTHLQALERQGVPLFYMEEQVTILSPTPRLWSTGGLLGDSLLSALRAQVPPLWQADGCLIGHLRETEDGPLLFLCNNASTGFCGPVKLCFSGPYEVAHPQEGSWSVQPTLELTLGAGLGVLIRRSDRGGARKAYQELAAEWGDWSCTPRSENCLALGEFRAIAFDPRDSPDALPESVAFGHSEVIDLLSPTSLHGSLLQQPGDRAFLAGFDWQAGEAPLRLVHDTDLGEGTMEFYLNGCRLPLGKRRMIYDPMNCVIDLAPHVRRGRNHLLWIQRRPGGGAFPLPYDGVRLFGDFHVDFPFGRPMPALLTSRPKGYRVGYPLPASQIGHPHYGGLLVYESRVILPDVDGLPVRMELGKGFESMEVAVNGVAVGTIWEAPWRVEIPAGLLKSGEANDLAIVCACSPAGYLQGLQRPSGFYGPIRFYTNDI